MNVLYALFYYSHSEKAKQKNINVIFDNNLRFNIAFRIVFSIIDVSRARSVFIIIEMNKLNN